jgi:hypothetical protein
VRKRGADQRWPLGSALKALAVANGTFFFIQLRYKVDRRAICEVPQVDRVILPVSHAMADDPQRCTQNCGSDTAVAHRSVKPPPVTGPGAPENA